MDNHWKTPMDSIKRSRSHGLTTLDSREYLDDDETEKFHHAAFPDLKTTTSRLRHKLKADYLLPCIICRDVGETCSMEGWRRFCSPQPLASHVNIASFSRILVNSLNSYPTHLHLRVLSRLSREQWQWFYSISDGEVTSYDKIWTARHKRDADHSGNQIVHGSTNQQIQNKFEFDVQGKKKNGAGSSIVTGSITSQSNNNHTNVGRADNVYVVLPRWFKVENQQTPSNSDGKKEIQMTSQRRQTVQLAINVLKQECRDIKAKLDELTSEKGSGLSTMFQKQTAEESRRESKIDRIYKNYLSLAGRVAMQQSLLDMFSLEVPWVPQDNFNEDLNFLRVMIGRAKLKLLQLS